MSRIKSKKEAKKLAIKYSEILRENKFPFDSIYLYGSYADNSNREWSDVDVAVVSEVFRKNRERHELKLWKFRRELNSLIEPTGFTPEDFKENASPLIYEIKKKGERVA